MSPLRDRDGEIMTRRHEALTMVIEAIAETEDCAPHDLDYSLYDHIETGALLTLVTSEQDDWELTFEVPDHTVTVCGDGRITVDDTLCRRLDRPLHRPTPR